MNIFAGALNQGKEAKVKYLAGEFQILVPGEFVRCAVTGRAIPLEELKYWSVELQEAYFDAEIAFQRYREIHDKAGTEH